MKKISTICCFLMLFFYSCSGKHNDVFIDNISVHYGKVQCITMGKDVVIFHFADGYNYQVNNYRFIQPGTRVAIYRTSDGDYAAIVD